MADMSFDAVIIGGGNKALVTAMYLTKYGGLSVGMFEERHELGGGWSTEEPAPGFMANTCSHGHFAHYHLPVYEDCGKNMVQGICITKWPSELRISKMIVVS